MPVGEVDGCHVVTVEGLTTPSLTLVQRLIVEHSASQCGYCTPGIVLSLTGFCLAARDFSDAAVLDALDGNLCRCTGYVAIRQAARALAQALRAAAVPAGDGRVAALIELGVLPPTFATIPARLARLPLPTPGAVGPSAVLVAGGTDLFVQRPEALREAPLRYLSHAPELGGIEAAPDGLHVGGAVSLEELRTSPVALRHFPTLESDLLLHSSTALRNRATLAGNVVNASPVGDMTIMLLALDARLEIDAEAGRRTTPLSAFFHGYKQIDLACGEHVRTIVIPYAAGVWFHFEKVSNRRILDIAAVNTAIALRPAADGTLAGVRLAAGGVAPVPLLVPGLEALTGRPIDAGLGDALAAAAVAAARPIDDVRGSAAYKQGLLKALVTAHVTAYLAERGAA
jgi:xanthine dehydrogenase small subunit